MSIKTPKISVIIPIYNDALYIQEAIRSVFSQKIEELEIIIINDGSTDNFEEKIECAGILWLKSAKHGPDKNNKKIQGKGWELAESERSIEDNLTLFHSIHNLFKLENPNPRPSSEQYPTEIQIGV